MCDCINYWYFVIYRSIGICLFDNNIAYLKVRHCVMKIHKVEEFELCLDIHTEEISQRISRRATIVTPIHVRIGPCCYPTDNWDDFSVVILSWWCEQLHFLRDGLTSCAELLFMDGPYRLHISPTTAENICRVRKFVEGKGYQTNEHTCDLRQIEEQIYLASSRLLALLQRLDYWDKDCDNLAKALILLKKEKE